MRNASGPACEPDVESIVQFESLAVGFLK